MTNKLWTTLSDIEAKAERKREARNALYKCFYFLGYTSHHITADEINIHGRALQKIRKYIEEN